jgi:fructose-specific phosphotransferase system IIA component
MCLKEMFSNERVCFNLKSATKSEVLDELIGILDDAGIIVNRNDFKQAVLNREEEFSTGVGMGIAIPHGKCSAVREASLVFGKSEKGIDYASVDGNLVHLFFLIAMPEEANNIHLRTLSEISRKLMHVESREKLFKAQSFEEFIKIFD